jgi:hypothetical protein
LTCAKKGGLISALRQESMDDELFDSVSIIIGALLDEGPVAGISKYEHAEEALRLYLRHAEKHAATLKHLQHVLNIQSWAESGDMERDDAESKGTESEDGESEGAKQLNTEQKGEILALCGAIIRAPAWKARIIAAIEQRVDVFNAVHAADQMDIDVSAALLPIVRQEPTKYCQFAWYFFANSDMAAELIGLYESALPLEEMAEGMGDYHFADKLNEEHQCLDHLLPLLASQPLKGAKLIKAGLNSRVVRERNMACRTLSCWTKELGKPLSEISPWLYAEITRVCDIEVNGDAKARMKKLIDGGFEE